MEGKISQELGDVLRDPRAWTQFRRTLTNADVQADFQDAPEADDDPPD